MEDQGWFTKHQGPYVLKQTNMTFFGEPKKDASMERIFGKDFGAASIAYLEDHPN